MLVSDSFASRPLFEVLLRYQRQQWTGKVCIAYPGEAGFRSELYLSLGRLVWVTGGIHPVRRWQRHVLRHCRTLELAGLVRHHQSRRVECWDYDILLLLLRRGAIAGTALPTLIQLITMDVLFDLVWVLTGLGRDLTGQFPLQITDVEGLRPATAGLLTQAPTLDVRTQLAIAQHHWQQWRGAGLAKVSPNLAPVCQLPQTSLPHIDKSADALHRLATGERSLRDLASLMQQSVLTVARSLLPSIQQGAIVLQTIPDLSQAIAWPLTATQPQLPVVVCIDDSSQVCQILADIIDRAHCQALCISDPLKVLPLLSQSTPALILLDLVMPIANGYEICTQLRQVSHLQTVPIIMLTGQDGIVDRVRATLVGATDFVSKPIVPEQILRCIEQYC